MRGRHKEYDGSENKQGKRHDQIATECSYYQLTIDGKEVIEIDVINMVMKSRRRRPSPARTSWAIGLLTPLPVSQAGRSYFEESDIMENINENENPNIGDPR